MRYKINFFSIKIYESFDYENKIEVCRIYKSQKNLI